MCTNQLSKEKSTILIVENLNLNTIRECHPNFKKVDKKIRLIKVSTSLIDKFKSFWVNIGMDPVEEVFRFW